MSEKLTTKEYINILQVDVDEKIAELNRLKQLYIDAEKLESALLNHINNDSIIYDNTGAFYADDTLKHSLEVIMKDLDNLDVRYSFYIDSWTWILSDDRIPKYSNIKLFFDSAAINENDPLILIKQFNRVVLDKKGNSHHYTDNRKIKNFAIEHDYDVILSKFYQSLPVDFKNIDGENKMVDYGFLLSTIKRNKPKCFNVMMNIYPDDYLINTQLNNVIANEMRINLQLSDVFMNIYLKKLHVDSVKRIFFSYFSHLFTTSLTASNLHILINKIKDDSLKIHYLTEINKHPSKYNHKTRDEANKILGFLLRKTNQNQN